MKKLLTLLLFFPLIAFSQLSRPAMISEINSKIYQNATHQITGTILNGVLQDMTNSSIFPASSGTVNYIPRWTGTTLLGNSLIYQNGSNIGIGTTSPGSALDVTGTGNFSSWITTPSIFLGTPSVAAGDIYLYNSSNSNPVIFEAGITASPIKYKTPAALPIAGQVLTAGVVSTSTSQLSWSYLITTTKSITAHAGGGQSSAFLLSNSFNRIDVCATDHNSVKLPAAILNSFYCVNNSTTNIADVYPAVGENFLNLSANTAVSIVGGNKIFLVCYQPGEWTIE